MAQAKLEAFLERLQKAKSTEALQSSIEDLREIYGVAHVIYHTVNKAGDQTIAVTYHPDWVKRYIENDYHRIDPVVLGAFRRFHPIDWKTLDWSSPNSRKFLRDAREAGVGNQGYSIPIWGPHGEFAMFTVNHRATDTDWERFTAENAKDFLIISHLVHQQGKRIVDSETNAPPPELSPREREALALLSTGLNRAEVADTLKISENTLRAYIDSARFKLGAFNVTHAVALALARGVIVP